MAAVAGKLRTKPFLVGSPFFKGGSVFKCTNVYTTRFVHLRMQGDEVYAPKSLFRLFIGVSLVALLTVSVLATGQARDALSDGSSDLGVLHWQGNGLRLEMAPLSHDQVRSFFAARGFDALAVDHIVKEGCVFRSAIGNQASDPAAPHITIDQSEWRLFVNADVRKLRTRADWQPLWQRLNVETAPRVAFKWALFPPHQEFASADYNWGMITFGLAPGTRFDLEVVWREGTERRVKLFKNVECAKQ